MLAVSAAITDGNDSDEAAGEDVLEFDLGDGDVVVVAETVFEAGHPVAFILEAARLG